MEVSKTGEYTGHRSAIYSLERGLEPGQFLSCGSEGYVVEWELGKEEGRALVQAPAAVFCMRMVAARKVLMLGLQNGELVFVDLVGRQVTKRIQVHRKAIFDLAVLPGGTHVIASSEDGCVSLWNLDRQEHAHTEQLGNASLRTMWLGEDRLYVGGSDGLIRSLDLGLELLHSWAAHQPSVFRILGDGAGTLYSAGRDAYLKRWEGEPLPIGPSHAVPAHNYAINDLIWSPEGWLLSASMDKSIKVWKREDLELLKVINHEKHGCHWHGVNRLLWCEDQLLSCSDDRKVMAWKIEG